MTTLGKLILTVAVVVLAALAWVFFGMPHGQAPAPSSATTSTTTPNTANKTYIDSKLSFSITYPADVASSSVDYSGYLPLTQTPLTSFILPASMYQGTNLEEAGVYVGASSSPLALTSCDSPIEGETTLGTETINGADFEVSTSSGAGAGNFYDSKIYRRIENGWCVEIVELLHSGNIGNYTPGSVKEFDKDKVESILESIVHSYRSIPTGA